MTLLSTLKRSLRAHQDSRNPVIRAGVRGLYAVRAFASASRRFLTDDKVRSTTLLRWFKSNGVHQTTVLTWMDRYPKVFSACRDLFAGQSELHILSFGCSSGEEVLTLRQYFPTAFITGADINPRNLALCRQRAVDDRIAFVKSERAAIASHGPFDLIFCMAVLQRTPHAVEAEGIDDLSRIYPFEKFDRQVSELDSYLKEGGVLVVHHTQYLFTDSAAARRYDGLEAQLPPESDGPRFDRQGRLLPGTVLSGSLFRKRQSVRTRPPAGNTTV